MPPTGPLSSFERFSFRVIDYLDRRARPLTSHWLRTVSTGWMTLGSQHMVKVRGIERLAGLRPRDGILIVSNHRSFFDMYMILLAMHRYTDLRQTAMCPVRADFFYQSLTGLAVNLLVGGGRMFPPFFREPAKNEFNKWALGRVAEELRMGSVLVGFHPEGTRNKGPDPYEPLPAQPGVGKLVMDAWPIVLPVFIHGMSSNIVADIASNFIGDRHAVIVFGRPVDLAPFRGMSNRLASHKRIADRLLEIIYGPLAEEERRFRAEFEAR